MIRPSRRSGRTTEKYSFEARLTSALAPGRRAEGGVESVGHVVPPERIEVATAVVVELGPHLQPVRLDQVERAQHAVQAREDAQHLLGVGVVPFAERGRRVETGVRVAVEGEHCGPGVVGRERHGPVLEAFVS